MSFQSSLHPPEHEQSCPHAVPKLIKLLSELPKFRFCDTAGMPCAYERDYEHLTILIVGDRKVIEPKLKETPYAPVVHVLDTEGNPQTNVTGLNGEPRKSDKSPRTTLR